MSETILLQHLTMSRFFSRVSTPYVAESQGALSVKVCKDV